MKAYKLLLLILLFAGLQSCMNVSPVAKTKYHEIGLLLTSCEGYAIVIGVMVNEGNFDHCKYGLLIKDSTSIIREYWRAKIEATKGDTLIIK